MWIDPICDRTQDDIDMGNAKGFCNTEDLNRLEDNCDEVAALLGISLGKRSGRWIATDLPTKSEFNRILENIRLISGQYTAYKTTPAPPQSPITHWQKWNDAERILFDVRRNYLDNMVSRCYCGEIATGENIGVV